MPLFQNAYKNSSIRHKVKDPDVIKLMIFNFDLKNIKIVKQINISILNKIIQNGLEIYKNISFFILEYETFHVSQKEKFFFTTHIKFKKTI